jgi:predicted RNase H-like HicB family nuclease
MRLTIRVERRADESWIAEVVELTWVVGHGVTREEAICRAEQSAIEEVAERVSRGHLGSSALAVSFEIAGPVYPMALYRTARSFAT